MAIDEKTLSGLINSQVSFVTTVACAQQAGVIDAGNNQQLVITIEPVFGIGL